MKWARKLGALRKKKLKSFRMYSKDTYLGLLASIQMDITWELELVSAVLKECM